jgi:hypothetical protein
MGFFGLLVGVPLKLIGGSFQLVWAVGKIVIITSSIAAVGAVITKPKRETLGPFLSAHYKHLAERDLKDLGIAKGPVAAALGHATTVFSDKPIDDYILFNIADVTLPDHQKDKFIGIFNGWWKLPKNWI